FASDFADIFEVRGIRRKHRGRASIHTLGSGGVVLSYRGLDKALRETAVSFEPAPTLLMKGTASYSLRLSPAPNCTVFRAVSSRGLLARSTQSFFQGLAGLHRERRQATRSVAAVETSNDVLNEILCRASADLRMLITETEDGPYPYAGIPWYSTTFGRDG